MNIVVLDGYALNPGDLSWDELKRLGGVTVYDRTPPGQILERSRGADILLTNKTPLRADVLAELSTLKYIGVLATGFDVVDVSAAKQQGVIVTNVPGYSTVSVAQSVFALLLELCQQVRLHSDAVFSGKWTSSPDFSFWLTPLTELAGKTMGIVGYGSIGEKVAHVASAFGMKVAAYRRNPSGDVPLPEFEWTDLPTLYRVADVISLHCPLTPETERMINRDTLSLMKPSAMLINTARGKLVDDEALADALKRGVIAGAALDVLSVEPPPVDHPLLAAPNCLITPHYAWATKEARGRLLRTAEANLQAYLNGSPVHVVNA